MMETVLELFSTEAGWQEKPRELEHNLNCPFSKSLPDSLSHSRWVSLLPQESDWERITDDLIQAYEMNTIFKRTDKMLKEF